MIESNSVMRHRDNSTSKHDQLFDNLIWLTTNEVAIYLRRLTKDGKPSVGAIRNLIYRGKLRARKFCGKLYFKRSEIDRLIETSELVGGF